MENSYVLKIFPLAQADMESIFAYISEELQNPLAAVNQIDDFEKAFATVCAFPESCPFVENEYVKDKTLRKLIVNNYIAFFRIKDQEVQVIRVLYGMRNYQGLL